MIRVMCLVKKSCFFPKNTHPFRTFSCFTKSVCMPAPRSEAAKPSTTPGRIRIRAVVQHHAAGKEYVKHQELQGFRPKQLFGNSGPAERCSQVGTGHQVSAASKSLRAGGWVSSVSSGVSQVSPNRV